MLGYFIGVLKSILIDFGARGFIRVLMEVDHGSWITGKGTVGAAWRGMVEGESFMGQGSWITVH